MEPEGSSPHSQAPATCPYPEPAQSSPHSLLPPPEGPVKISLHKKKNTFFWEVSKMWKKLFWKTVSPTEDCNARKGIRREEEEEEDNRRRKNN